MFGICILDKSNDTTAVLASVFAFETELFPIDRPLRLLAALGAPSSMYVSWVTCGRFNSLTMFPSCIAKLASVGFNSSLTTLGIQYTEPLLGAPSMPLSTG